jgi:hypothetical protein
MNDQALIHLARARMWQERGLARSTMGETYFDREDVEECFDAAASEINSAEIESKKKPPTRSKKEKDIVFSETHG